MAAFDFKGEMVAEKTAEIFFFEWVFLPKLLITKLSDKKNFDKKAF